MDELSKIKKVINKEMNEADKEVLLVIDGTTGQNAISQVRDNYDYIIINDDLDTCVAQLNAIVSAAHSTPSRNEIFIKNIREELKMLAKGE